LDKILPHRESESALVEFGSARAHTVNGLVDWYQSPDGCASQEAGNQTNFPCNVPGNVEAERLLFGAWVILRSPDSVSDAATGSCEDERVDPAVLGLHPLHIANLRSLNSFGAHLRLNRDCGTRYIHESPDNFGLAGLVHLNPFSFAKGAEIAPGGRFVLGAQDA
jgi:hypothetical protein